MKWHHQLDHMQTICTRQITTPTPKRVNALPDAKPRVLKQRKPEEKYKTIVVTFCMCTSLMWSASFERTLNEALHVAQRCGRSVLWYFK